MSNDGDKREFRVIIAGGGPAGLSFANMLALADIDFLLLERYPAVVTDVGANITLLPHSTRVFDGMGLLERCEGNYGRLGDKITMSLDGTVKNDVPIFHWMEEDHGYPCMSFPRSLLCKVLYEGLGPEHQRKIRTGAAVEDIAVNERGVRVMLSDGTTEAGSLLVGADGVHSTTRQFIRRQVQAERGTASGGADGNASQEEEDDDASDEPLTTFQCLYGCVMPPPADLDIPTGKFFETHGTDVCTQFLKSDRAMYFGLFRRVRPSPTRERRARFTEEEIEAYKATFVDVHITPKVTAGQLLSYRSVRSGGAGEEASGGDGQPSLWARLVQQPEGLAQWWRYGARVALLGDAAMQVTSTAGLGFNTSLQSGVFLANKLRAALVDSSTDAVAHGCLNLGEETLERVLAEYEEVRRTESEAVRDMSARMIRGNTWDGWTAWLATEWLIPWVFGDRVMIRLLSKNVIAKGRTLDCGNRTDKVGTMPWDN